MSQEELHSQEVMAMLADQTDSPEALSHLGILLLDQALGPDATHTVITDATAGETYIDQAIRTGTRRQPCQDTHRTDGTRCAGIIQSVVP